MTEQTPTIREMIAAKRAKREANSAVQAKLRDENARISAEILELENAIRPPKKAKYSPDDKVTVLYVEPAQVRVTPVKLG